MKMAKADPEEFDGCMEFVNEMDAFFCGRSFFSTEECWREWDDEDDIYSERRGRMMRRGRYGYGK